MVVVMVVMPVGYLDLVGAGREVRLWDLGGGNKLSPRRGQDLGGWEGEEG
jgi:hypothetical protein